MSKEIEEITVKKIQDYVDGYEIVRHPPREVMMLKTLLSSLEEVTKERDDWWKELYEVERENLNHWIDKYEKIQLELKQADVLRGIRDEQLEACKEQIELDKLALEKEKLRTSEAEYLRNGMQTRVNELSIENESLKETINFWKKSYNEEIAHSKQAEERVKELEEVIETYKQSSAWQRKDGMPHSSEEEELFGVLEKMRGDLKDYTSPNLLVEQLTERIGELEKGRTYLIRLFKMVAPECEPLDDLSGLVSQLDNYVAGQNQKIKGLEATLASIKADPSIGKLIVEVSEDEMIDD